MAARLLVQLAGAEFAFELRGESVRVGAASSNGLVLRDPGVGREHFEVRRVGSVWRLVDLETASGTRVNGLYVNKQDLRNGDVITVGEARLTFLVDDSVAPAPIPEAAAPLPSPAPIPAPAPVPGQVPWSPPSAASPAPVPGAWAPPSGTPPPAAPAVPPPLPYAPSRPSAPPPPSYRPRTSQGSGGTAGAAVGMLFFVGLVLAGGAVAWKYVVPPDRVDPNPALLAKLEGLMAEDRLAEVVKAAEDADPSFPPTAKPIRNLAWEANRKLKERSEVAAEQEAEDYYQRSVKAYRLANPDDYTNIVLRCDEFLRRWPDHPRVPEVAFARLRAAGEPSPALAERGGFTSWAELTRAAEAEAARLLVDDRYADAFAVYDRFVLASPRTVLPEYMDEFMEEVNRVRAALTKKANEAFEDLEVKAMVLEDQGRYAETEDLYRRARDGFGVPDIRVRCDAELERLREHRMK